MTGTAGTPIRILIVDDHEVVRLGLRMLLSRAGGFEVVGEAGNVETAIEAAGRLAPDVVLLDLRLPDGSGVEACREILSEHPTSRVLFLTSYLDEEAVLATVMAGAQGYLLKEIGSDELLRAIRSIMEGRSILDQAAIAPVMAKVKVLAEPSAEGRDAALSAQERRVLALVAKGQTNKEIAAALELSPKTVKNYLNNIFQKLRVTRRSQAAALFVRRFAP